jgi:hypothetical protein
MRLRERIKVSLALPTVEAVVYTGAQFGGFRTV